MRMCVCVYECAVGCAPGCAPGPGWDGAETRKAKPQPGYSSEICAQSIGQKKWSVRPTTFSLIVNLWILISGRNRSYR
jgi:hypothetical protein